MRSIRVTTYRMEKIMTASAVAVEIEGISREVNDKLFSILKE